MARIEEQVKILEKQLLHFCIDTPTKLIEEDIFLSDEANELILILSLLQEKALSFIKENILSHTMDKINEKILDAILDTNYDALEIDYYKDALRKIKILQKDIRSEAIGVLESELEKGNDTDLDLIKGTLYEIEEAVNKIENKKSKYLSFYDMLEKNTPFLQQRHSKTRISSGCFNFDKILPSIVPGIGICAGYSGATKSTFISYLTRIRLAKRLPTLLVNTELNFNSVVEGLISPLLQVSYYDVLGIREEEEREIESSVLFERYEALKIKYLSHPNFSLYPQTSCNLNDINLFIKDKKKDMKLGESDILFLFIDLLSMVSDFNNVQRGYNKADTIESAMNKLNEICLSNNVFCLGTVQLKRAQTKIMIQREEDLEKFIPTLDGIKSSGAYEERARFLWAIDFPLHNCMKNPCNPIIKDLQSSIVNLISLKDSFTGMTGSIIKYYFDKTYKTYVPYIEEGV